MSNYFAVLNNGIWKTTEKRWTPPVDGCTTEYVDISIDYVDYDIIDKQFWSWLTMSFLREPLIDKMYELYDQIPDDHPIEDFLFAQSAFFDASECRRINWYLSRLIPHMPNDGEYDIERLRRLHEMIKHTIRIGGVLRMTL